MRTGRFRRALAMLGIIAVACALGIAAVVLFSTSDARTPAKASLPPLPQPRSDYLNTGSEARYVGAGQCVECHEAEASAHAGSGHARAFGEVRPQEEPPPSALDRERIGRRYVVLKQDGQLRHQEVLPADGLEPEIVLSDFPMKYFIGSSTHARSYLVEEDGFLWESPLTWYSHRGAWDLSPGYDRPDHPSFSRLVGQECLHCHTGRTEALSDQSQSVRILEPTIQCENCHGPGSLHVELRRAGREVVGIDRTIVNPTHLGRDLKEAICAQCHVWGDSHAIVRGRQLQDFRPGLPLSDFRIDYRATGKSGPMSVTSHFAQLSSSKCYQHSADLTCSTCHSGHGPPAESDRVEHLRNVCLGCHGPGTAGCGIAEAERRNSTPADDCSHCHMRREPTQIPHVAFTNHWIRARPRDEKPSSSAETVELTPTGRLPAGLSRWDEDRCRALAMIQMVELLEESKAREMSDQAFRILKSLRSEGHREPSVSIALAWFLWERRSPDFLPVLEEGLDDPSCSFESRVNGLFLLAGAQMQRHRTESAREILEALVQMRPDASYWSLLGECRKKSKDPIGAIQAYEKAIQMIALRPEVHKELAALHQATGNPGRELRHRRLASRLERLMRNQPADQ